VIFDYYWQISAKDRMAMTSKKVSLSSKNI